MTDTNTGNCNTGNCNTGDCNTGDCNTGCRNTGYRNTGDFNTITPSGGYYFNKWLDRKTWEDTYKPDWIYEPSPTTWVYCKDMTEQEKIDNPDYETVGGYLRKNDMKEEWRKAYESASDEDIQAVRGLPNFDYDVFEEITGLDLRPKDTVNCEGKEVEIDGVIYVLKLKGN